MRVLNDEEADSDIADRTVCVEYAVFKLSVEMGIGCFDGLPCFFLDPMHVLGMDRVCDKKVGA